jgi:hypothetical protein
LCRFVFMVDPRGLVCVWALVPYTKKLTLLGGQVPQLQALLVAAWQSPLHGQVVCLDVCTSGQVNVVSISNVLLIVRVFL